MSTLLHSSFSSSSSFAWITPRFAPTEPFPLISLRNGVVSNTVSLIPLLSPHKFHFPQDESTEFLDFFFFWKCWSKHVWFNLKWNFWLQKCKVIESVKLENGRPSSSEFTVSSGGGSAIPSFLVAPNARIQDLVNRNGTRLRIFSGTANPALAQVSLQTRFGFSPHSFI